MKTIRLLVISMAVSSALVAGPGCGEKDPINIIRGQKNEDVRTTFQLQMTETLKGETRYILHTVKAHMYEKRRKIIAESLTVWFYDKGKVSSVLTSDAGEVNQRSNDMLARGNVIVISEGSGSILQTDRLNWDSRKHKFYTDQPVRITRSTNVVTGIGLDADPNLEHTNIHSNIKVTIKDFSQSPTGTPVDAKQPPSLENP